MIPLSQQLTSLEISKRLKELGVPQESLFYHCISNVVESGWEILTQREIDYRPEVRKYCSSYTSAELLSYIPNYGDIIEYIYGDDKKHDPLSATIINLLKDINEIGKMLICLKEEIQKSNERSSRAYIKYQRENNLIKREGVEE